MVLRKADSRDSGQSGEREEWTSSSGDIWALWGKKRSITPPPDSHRAPPPRARTPFLWERQA